MALRSENISENVELSRKWKSRVAGPGVETLPGQAAGRLRSRIYWIEMVLVFIVTIPLHVLVFVALTSLVKYLAGNGLDLIDLMILTPVFWIVGRFYLRLIRIPK